MAITDAERHRLHTKLDTILGEEDAAVLISHLPPSGWSDVARTRDLDQLEQRIHARFEAVDHRFEAVDNQFGMVQLQFEKQEARFEAALERNLRLQTNRFFVGMGALVTLATAVQAALARVLGG